MLDIGEPFLFYSNPLAYNAGPGWPFRFAFIDWRSIQEVCWLRQSLYPFD